MSVLQKYNDVPETLDALSSKVVDCIFQVHKTLGAGFLEKIYEDCLCVEFEDRKIAYKRQFPVSISYKGKSIPADFRLDLVVENQIVLELKAIDKIHPVHEAQIYSYLRMSGLPMGFLVNFNVPLIKDGIQRFAPKQLRNFVTSCQSSEGNQ